MFRYVNDDPVNYFDPEGKVLAIPIAIGADVIIEAVVGISIGTNPWQTHL